MLRKVNNEQGKQGEHTHIPNSRVEEKKKKKKNIRQRNKLFELHRIVICFKKKWKGGKENTNSKPVFYMISGECARVDRPSRYRNDISAFTAVLTGGWVCPIVILTSSY